MHGVGGPSSGGGGKGDDLMQVICCRTVALVYFAFLFFNETVILGPRTCVAIDKSY